MNQQYKAFVIGLGKIGMMYDFEPQRQHPASHVFAYAMEDSICLTGAMDCNENQRTYLNQAAPNAKFYTSIRTGLQENSDVDIVSICTPPQYHLDNIREVLAVAKPKIIFCEKPLLNSVQERKDIEQLLMTHPQCLLIPNISRRWNIGLRKVKDAIDAGIYGNLEKIHIRYTRGIYNTGAHLFDLLKMWTGGKIRQVNVLNKVYTSSEKEGENSFTFFFEQDDGVYGFAEATNDEQYYLFDIDLYFTAGRISMRSSGDEILYFKTKPHHLFVGFRELSLEKQESGLLAESCMGNAISNLVDVLSGEAPPFCRVSDAIYPLYVAEALKKSYLSRQWERVDVDE